jgi:hypothetical protein
MTTYAYTITFNDSEIIMLQSALELMVKHCQEQLDKGKGAPFLAHKHSAESVLKRLNDNVKQKSGNNFFDRD